jgi:hypothetical protein
VEHVSFDWRPDSEIRLISISAAGRISEPKGHQQIADSSVVSVYRNPANFGTTTLAAARRLDAPAATPDAFAMGQAALTDSPYGNYTVAFPKRVRRAQIAGESSTNFKSLMHE